MESILGRIVFVRQDWVFHRLRDSAFRKVACDNLRGFGEGWAAESYYLTQFWYNEKENGIDPLEEVEVPQEIYTPFYSSFYSSFQMETD